MSKFSLREFALPLVFLILLIIPLFKMANNPKSAFADRPEFVTFCHAAGLEGTTKFNTLTLPWNAVYGEAGHLNENGTGAAGHEQDYVGPCHSETPTPTPVNGGWSDYGPCEGTCGTGIKTRTCTNPSPSNDGADCVGLPTDSCTLNPCPIDGKWSEWSECSAACGGGTWTRTCTNPAPQYNGAYCSGDATGRCNEQACEGNDMCPNIPDLQTVIPEGYELIGEECLPIEQPTATPTITPTPTPTPTDNPGDPDPNAGKHSSMSKDDATCSNNRIEVYFDTKEDGVARPGVEVTFTYKGNVQKARTTNSGRAHVWYSYSGEERIYAEATDGYPSQSLQVNTLNCPSGTTNPGGVGGAVLGTASDPVGPSDPADPSQGQILGASTSTLGNTGVFEDQLLTVLRAVCGFAVGIMLSSGMIKSKLFISAK